MAEGILSRRTCFTCGAVGGVAPMVRVKRLVAALSTQDQAPETKAVWWAPRGSSGLVNDLEV